MLLPGFHPQILQPCSMHSINLGLCFDVNGVGLIFGCIVHLCNMCACKHVIPGLLRILETKRLSLTTQGSPSAESDISMEQPCKNNWMQRILRSDLFAKLSASRARTLLSLSNM